MDDPLLVQARNDMEAVLDVVREDLSTVKTGRAKPALVEHIEVLAYNTKMPLIELATISAPDPHLLVIQPWDETVLENIAKAIATSDLHLNPVVDQSLIRIQIPSLTEERREELVKLVHQKLESGRVLLRQVRQDVKKKLEGMKGQPGVSEDDTHRQLENLEKATEEFMGKIVTLGEEKEGELRTV
ncbi:MAG: ribosome recycling factor [Candidatus Chisholmbacteria bacterium RIFCSPHIGHO2_12_FULL_49_9]|uniref:Ribosome-recycling factor n=1 Tax=Candidatus Chisholmbacteria bacterium RIFCSPHIGHO2_01_FULL_52_32 TaxID=1797591 RepID=A0A1G1VS66_9BACT|nr:MAG: ribosome recycling factor [Candidatus Chisholmbacteria bacterium RIFCSPHIGHO2_01_FULL_52_32]OGY19265.1 MAG: ribosome recycling factor [Candidatus Chisholmbacteria bacterium RIFCSPHIGHO2_12_FULL_49_9]OGY20383.1 MAG: ribosome recycling factor [Candidatus Chisholmbacteria bacterium RIFCSPLOWO2_01_FULL_50_28]